MAKVLLVDDDRALLFIMGEYLEAHGMEFESAGSVAQARKLLRRSHFDVVISDLNMPGESGLDLFRYVSARYPDLPFILMTGCNDSRVKREALSMGVNRYIEKPFQILQLIQAINGRGLSGSRAGMAVPAA